MDDFLDRNPWFLPTAAVVGMGVLLGLIVFAASHSSPSRAPVIVQDGTYSQPMVVPVQQQPVIVQQHDNSWANWMLWHSITSPTREVHRETVTVHHTPVAAPAPVVLPTPINIRATPVALKPAAPVAPAPVYKSPTWTVTPYKAPVSAVKTSSSSARPMSAPSFRAGGRR